MDQRCRLFGQRFFDGGVSAVTKGRGDNIVFMLGKEHAAVDPHHKPLGFHGGDIPTHGCFAGLDGFGDLGDLGGVVGLQILQDALLPLKL